MVDGDWQHNHFRSGEAKTRSGGRSFGRLIVVSVALIALFGAGGLTVSEWLGYTDLGLRTWITRLFSGAEAQSVAPPSEDPALPPADSPTADHGPRVRQLKALIDQQQRGIDLMQREMAEATRGEDAARRDADAAASRVTTIESYIASTRLTARQLADARSSLSAATADLNNARRRAKELGEKRQSLAARIVKASTTRDDAQRETERLTTPMPVAAPP